MLSISYARQSDQANSKRVNAEDDETLSIGSQLTACREKAAENKDKIIREFSEQFTGLTDARPQYQEMIRFLKDNIRRHPKPDDPQRIRKLYTYKYHRLGRKADDIVPLIGYFATMDIQVVPVRDQPFGNTPAEKAMLYMLMTFAEMQVADSITHATDARRQLTNNGKLVCAGPPLYGYRYDMAIRTRVIVAEQAEVVRRIFDLAARGDGCDTIARRLQAEGILTPRGRDTRWSARTIGRLIKEPSYKGEPMVANRYKPTKERYRNGKHKIERVEGKPVGAPTPAIVSAELWERANKAASTRSKPQVRHDHWLIGRVVCACGKAMVRSAKPNRPNTGGWAWMCVGYAKRRGCNNCYIPNKEIEPEAWDRLRRWVKDPEVVVQKLKELEGQLIDRNWEQEEKSILKTVARLRGKMSDLLDSFGSATRAAVRDAVTSKIDALAEEIESHEKMLASVQEHVAEARQTAAVLDEMRETIRARVWQGEATEAEKSALAEAIGLRIVVMRAEDGSRKVDFHAFGFSQHRALLWPFRSGISKKPLVKGQPDGFSSQRTTDKSPVAQASSARSR